MSWKMASMHTKKRSGPSIDPCGTPAYKDSIWKNNSSSSIEKVIFKRCENFSPDTSSFEFIEKTTTPNTIESFADVTADSSYLFTRIKHCEEKWTATWQNQQNECAPSEDSDQPGHPPSLISLLSALNW